MADYKALQPLKIKETAFVNIGAKDICSLEFNWKGHLRKEGKLERGLQKLGALSKVTNIQWRQYFAVLSQGCLYIFSDEHAGSPKIHFSLKNFNRLRRNFTIPFSFDLLPCTEEGKVYRFSCNTDTERLDWMRAIYVSMLSVHSKPLHNDLSYSKKSDEYNFLESEINVGSSSAAKSNYEIHDLSSDESEDYYDKPDESAMIRSAGNRYDSDPTSTKASQSPTCSKVTQSPTGTKKTQSPTGTKKMSKSLSSDCYNDCSSGIPKLQRSFSDCSAKLSSPEKIDLETTDSQIFEKLDNKINSVSKQKMHKPNVAPKPKKPNVAPKPKKTKIGKSDSIKVSTGSIESPRIAESETSNNPSSPKRHSISNSPEPKSISGSPEPKNAEPKTRNSSNEEPYINTHRQDDGYENPITQEDPSLEYMFDGNKEDAAWQLETTPVRTFLLRESAEPGKKVLVVKTSNGLKSFKVGFQSNKFGIQVGVAFDTIHQFVEYYKRHNLPNLGITLRFGYNSEFKETGNLSDSDYEPVEEPICH